MAGGKPRIADIARLARVSSTAVSFVLNGRDKGISEETRRRIWDAACELGYAKASRIPLQGWTRIAFLTGSVELFNFHTSFFANVYSHLQKRAVQSKFELLLLEFQPSGEGQGEERINEMLSMGVELFLSSSRETIELLLKRGLKAILVQGGSMDGCVCVHCDDFNAGRLAAGHALEMGHRVAGTMFPAYKHSRFEGFVSHFEANGGSCPKAFQWTLSFDHGAMAVEVERLARKARRGGLPSLFYCFADNLMFPAIRGLSKAGLKVPDDVSLIGTDNLYWGIHATPAFTTVDLCEEFFAERLIDAIGHVLSGGQPYALAVPVKMLPRETVKDLLK